VCGSRYVKESRLLVKVAGFGDAMAAKAAAEHDHLLLQPKRGQQLPSDGLAPYTERAGGSCQNSLRCPGGFPGRWASILFISECQPWLSRSELGSLRL